MERGKLFCFGLGYSAGHLAHALRLRRWPVAGTTRQGGVVGDVDTHPFDGTAPLADWPGRMDGVDHILISCPPGEGGDPVLRQHRDDLIAMAGRIKWLGYLSTTGVYGDHGGAWVDEQSATEPVNPRSVRRLAAERAWQTLWREHELPVHIFRLAGIYGPGRNGFVSLRQGRARRIVKPGQVFSRIHVADIAEVLMLSMARPNPGAIYNVCDDEATPPQEVVRHAAELAGLAPPPEVPFEEADLSPMARSFYQDNKRVSNDRIKQELGLRLKFPTYREGLAALIDDAHM